MVQAIVQATSSGVRYTRCSTDSLSLLAYPSLHNALRNSLPQYYVHPSGVEQVWISLLGNGTEDTHTVFATMWVGFCCGPAPLARIQILHFDLSCGAVPLNIADRSYEVSQASISLEQRY